MLKTFLSAKLHRAVVTECELEYEGSIGIDEEFLEQSGILPYEQVDVLNINNGERFTTYAVKAPKGSKKIAIMGAAARKAQKGDLVIICSYCQLSENEIRQGHKAKVLFFDSENNIKD